jgi:allantoinase
MSEGVHAGRVDLHVLAEVFAAAAARRFSLRGKGVVETGADADLVLVDAESTRVLEAAELRSRHRISPYVGREIRGRVVRTILRGTTVALNGEVVGAPSGRLVRPGA